MARSTSGSRPMKANSAKTPGTRYVTRTGPAFLLRRVGWKRPLMP